jgi:cold shock CspA family protein
MPFGRIKNLVHLSQQSFLPSARLVPDHNDQGYGIIEDDTGREVYFSADSVESRTGFDHLHAGQRLEYTLEDAPYLRAKSVKSLESASASVSTPAA